MPRRRRITLVLIAAVAVVAGGLWANNTSAFDRAVRPLKVLAHRGVTQTTSVDLGNDRCFARNIAPPRHAFVENTLASMREAVRLGADGIEIDVQPTTDGEFVVPRLDPRLRDRRPRRHA